MICFFSLIMIFKVLCSITKYALLISTLLLLSGVCRAQTDEETQTSVTKTTSDITIDGSVEEAAWEEAVMVRLNHEHFPENNATPPVSTTCLVMYDSNNLYVSFKASDPQPEDIRAHLMDRDSQEKLMRDDHVGITIDPFNNGQWGLQFRVNPLGVQADAIYFNRQNSTDYSWDAIWESNGSITKKGYEVEIRIPISSINVPSDSLQNWRFSAFRNYPRSVQHRIRSHRVNLNEQSFMAQFDQLTGFRNLSSGLNLKVNPVLTAKRTDHSAGENSSALDHGPITLNPGGNIQWGIKPNLNLSATINPDFSQIEADALQFRENRRFVLSFPEKRPFFLESSEIFSTSLNAVFTRSIVEPNAGLKMTGKLESQSFGTFITQDQRSRILFPANQSSESKILNDRSYSEIIRYRNQITEHAAIGILGEGRQSANTSYHNYVGGIDGYWQFLDSNTLRFQYLQSNTDYSNQVANNYNQPGDPFGGTALNLNFNHSSRNWAGSAEFTSISSGFRNDNGFFPRANFRDISASGQRILRGNSDHWFSTIQFGPAFQLTTNQSGQLTDRSISFSATYTGPLQSVIQTSYDISKRRFDGKMYQGMDTGVFFFRVQPGGFLSKFRLYTAYGEAIDFTHARRAKELIIHPGLAFNIGRNFNLEIDPNFQRLSHHGMPTFTTYLLGTRMIYHFNKQTFVRSVFQYRYVDRNRNEFNDPASVASSTESFFYQLLFSYKINPQSKLFLGYSSGYGSVNEHPLRIQNRTGYLKVGYSWVF